MSGLPKLLPCPFCGATPDVDPGFSDAPYPPGQEDISCQTVIVGVPGVPDQSCGARAIGAWAWNRRATIADDRLASQNLVEPKRIHLRRTRGWRMPPNTVSVARPTTFGNPYRIGDPGIPDAEVAVYRYRLWLSTSESGRRASEAIRYLLRGKNLACWCPLHQPCHADVLLEIANRK